MKNIYLVGDRLICEKVAGAFADLRWNSGYVIKGFIIIGSDSSVSSYGKYLPTDLSGLESEIDSVFVQLGSKYLDIPENRLHSLVHPTSIISNRVTFGASTVVMPKCIFYQNVRAGKFNFFMNCFKSGHDVSIGDCCVMGYYSFLGSYCVIESGVVLGHKSTVKEHVTVRKDSLLLPGSALIENTGINETWKGIPARKMYL